MWPTPTATPYGSSQNGINGVGGEFERPSANKPSLENMARMQAEIVPTGSAWPTPRAVDGTRGPGESSKRDGGPSLTTVSSQWATPAARDWKDGACVEANVPTKALLGRQAVRWATPVASDNANRMTKAAPSHGNGHGRVLAGQAASWPTPVATLQSTAPSTTGATTLNGAASATSGLLDPTTSTDGEPTSPPADPSLPSSERRVLNPRFVEALMGLPPGWVSALPRTTAARGPASSDDLISYEFSATVSSGNRPPLPSSTYDDEPLEDDDDEA
jgi:hypothetical protein